MDNRIALVIGATGVVGSHVASKLIESGWQTFGLARNPKSDINNLIPVTADLLDFENLEKALDDIRPTHIFYTSWLRKNNEAENIVANRMMIRNLLQVVAQKKSLHHFALVTGLKHYMGPFDAYAKKGNVPETPLRETSPRLDIENFYYAQEDELFEAAARENFSWSVHRPHTIIGKAVGNAMNLGMTLAVYASICKETERKFRWPGSAEQWNGISDLTDANILAHHLIWASTEDVAKNQAFNIVNGDIFRWRWLWKQIADWFNIEMIGFEGEIQPLEKEMENDAEIWKTMAEKYNLKVEDINQLVSAWHSDTYLGRKIEINTDMSKSRVKGFNIYQKTEESFFKLFENLRLEKIIP